MHPLNLKRTRVLLALTIFASISISALQAANEQPQRPWLRSARSNRTQLLTSRNQANRTQSVAALAAPAAAVSAGAVSAVGSAVEVAPPINLPASSSSLGQNRSTRTAEVFQNGDGYNIFVTNTCELDSMKVNIKTSRPFYGVIHTRNETKKARCSVDGNGDSEFELEIPFVLNTRDPEYCGVVRARRESASDKDVLSVVISVRLHRIIELPDDRFFLLNCTNRCSNPDCSKKSADLRLSDEVEPVERENGTLTKQDECTIWNFPWAITLLWCLGILLLAMIISHCIMCSSLQCRCVKREIEEREPSVYEGASDLDNDDYDKRHPYRIEYDNKDIYKTSNNYAPYCLEETKAKSRPGKHHRSAR